MQVLGRVFFFTYTNYPQKIIMEKFEPMKLKNTSLLDGYFAAS